MYLPASPVGNGPSSLALSPDASLLAVLDYLDGVIAVVDPVAMKMKAMYPVLTSLDIGCGGTPIGISPVQPHRMMVDIACSSNLFGGLFHLVNLDTGGLTCTGVVACASNGTDINFGLGIASMASTLDGSKVFLASSSGGGSDVTVGLLDFSANKLTSGFAGNFNDSAINTDGTIFAANFETSDSQLNPVSIMAFEPYTDSGKQSFKNVFGEKLSPGGSLLFVPQTSGIDLFDVHTGRLVHHVVLPDAIPLNSGALALDETGTKMFMTSTTGVMIAQLNQSPLSIATVSPSTGTSGTAVKLRGSGFVSGAVVTFGTVQSASTFVDSNTLQAMVPSISLGPVRITVVNPDGHEYAFDDAFTVN
jgi:hypothetical protein